MGGTLFVFGRDLCSCCLQSSPYSTWNSAVILSALIIRHWFPYEVMCQQNGSGGDEDQSSIFHPTAIKNTLESERKIWFSRRLWV